METLIFFYLSAKNWTTNAKERISMTKNYNDIICALVLVRIGQELGTDSSAARAIHDAISALLNLLRISC